MCAAAAVDGDFLSGWATTLEAALVPARARARLLGEAIILATRRQGHRRTATVSATVSSDGACQLALPFPPRLIWIAQAAPDIAPLPPAPSWIRPGAEQLALFPEVNHG